MAVLKRCVAIYPPMLDLFVEIESDFLEKNSIEINTIVSYSEEKHSSVQKYVSNKIEKNREELVFRAGGATFNTQKILSKWMECFFFGIIGCDSYGSLIEEKMQGTQVKIYLDKRSTYSTAWAYVFITEDKRTLLANQDKNVCYSEKAKQRIHYLIEKSTVFYFVSFMFFLPNLVADCMPLYKEKKAIGFCSIINLSSEEIVSIFKDKIMEIIKTSDFVIGNASEYYVLSGTKDEESLIKWADSLNIGYAITNGPEVVAGRIPGGPLRKVTPISVGRHLNTNGAGDSFAAGFIGALANQEYAHIKDILPLLEKGVESSYGHIMSLKKAQQD